jgi:hypothetical protein
MERDYMTEPTPGIASKSVLDLLRDDASESSNENGKMLPNTTDSVISGPNKEKKRIKQQKRRQCKRENKRFELEHLSTAEPQEEVKPKARRFKLGPEDRKRLGYFLQLVESYKRAIAGGSEICDPSSHSFGRPGIEERLANALDGKATFENRGEMRQLLDFLEEDVTFLRSERTKLQRLYETVSLRTGSGQGSAAVPDTLKAKLPTVLKYALRTTTAIDLQRTHVANRLSAANRAWSEWMWTKHEVQEKQYVASEAATGYNSKSIKAWNDYEAALGL